MAKINKKAYLRYDGNGKVIPMSMVLRTSKPRVGNWKEIDATLCCSPSTTTTTTTT